MGPVNDMPACTSTAKRKITQTKTGKMQIRNRDCATVEFFMATAWRGSALSVAADFIILLSCRVIGTGYDCTTVDAVYNR